MTAPNRSTLWARTLIDELEGQGLRKVVIAPGSRSTPLTVAAEAADLETMVHLDERSAGFFALGQAKRTGDPSAVISTSGTGAVNFHPAVVEAHQSRTPLVVLTADRPPELQDSGANQTIDQEGLYGPAPRYSRTLPTPDPAPRSLRSLRTTVTRAIAASKQPDPGPVHLNIPFRKPLAPVEDETEQALIEAVGPQQDRRNHAIRSHPGVVSPTAASRRTLRSAIEAAERGVIVAGPLAPKEGRASAIRSFARRTGFPLLADPLSNLRFGPVAEEVSLFGGYDGYLGTSGTKDWPDPDLIVRFGASPTSKPLRHYLRDSDARGFLVDPTTGWREATFTTTDRIQSSISPLVEALAEVDRDPNPSWHRRFERAESIHWDAVTDRDPGSWEGGVVAQVLESVPDPATVFVSNSMPVRDLDRYGRPRDASLTVLGNRGASGIDGITSTALGAGEATTDPLIAITGDLAYFHDMNGLIALGRFGLDGTIVLLNNDGGGIFHKLPIADFEPPFESHFETPHGLDFAATEALYDLTFDRIDPGKVGTAVESAAGSPGTNVIEVPTDGAKSTTVRESIRDTVGSRLQETDSGNLF